MTAYRRHSPHASRLRVSFSGGETSAFMALLILERLREGTLPYDDVAVVFANTGCESEETLDFVRLCDERLGFGTHWIEAEIHHGRRKGPTARRVTFATAARHGEPFEQFILKHGIPGPTHPQCTDRLKTDPMESYCRNQLGWPKGSYDTAVGIRVDEIDRISSRADFWRLVYPLVSWWPTTKPAINAWWAEQDWRLRLRGYQGNCRWCWKKSKRKLLTLMDEDPAHFRFPAEMEARYSTHKASSGERRFFRGNLTTIDLAMELALHKLLGTFLPAEDSAQVVSDDPDEDGGCQESCEPFGDG